MNDYKSQRGHSISGPDPYFPWFSLGEDTGFDNILLPKPKVIDNIEYKVKENVVWRCMAGVNEHRTNMVHGEKPRVLLSFGYFIKVEDAKDKKWFK